MSQKFNDVKLCAMVLSYVYFCALTFFTAHLFYYVIMYLILQERIQYKNIK